MEIHIECNTSYSLKDLENKTLYTNKDYEIYQIYGYHSVFGDNVLLYISKADKQTFHIRLNQETWW